VKVAKGWSYVLCMQCSCLLFPLSFHCVYHYCYLMGLSCSILYLVILIALGVSLIDFKSNYLYCF
jgi:hypothetical protein